MENLHFTEHAILRQQQRGISTKTIKDIVHYYDHSEYCGRGCQALHLTCKKSRELIKKGLLSAQEADGISRACVVISSNTTVITVYWIHRRNRMSQLQRSQSSYRRRARRKPRRR